MRSGSGQLGEPRAYVRTPRFGINLAGDRVRRAGPPPPLPSARQRCVSRPGPVSERTIPALTLWQPWASAMAVGLKGNETRSWWTDYRGPIAIHAAKRPLSVDDLHFMLTFRQMFPEVAYELPLPRRLPFGAVVAIGKLIDVRAVVDIAPAPLERFWGNYAADRFVWQIAELKPVDPPIPARGRQRLWNWTVPEGFEL